MKTVIYGSGATARMAAEYLANFHAGTVADFIENDNITIGDLPIFDASALMQKFPPENYAIIICIGYQHGGMNAKRKMLYELLDESCYYFTSVYPDQYGPNDFGAGSFIMDGVILHTGAYVGNNCYIASNTVIGHDVEIHDHVWINANVSIDGGATIGEQCVIGAGAVIGAGVRLGERTLVGPGAVVLRDTEPDSVYLAPEAVKHRFSSNVFVRMGA